ncbi:glycoside hydrolase [Micromonospora phytophila]|uniref:WD40/YVTN/BNR-like repeat-containing protein n=1 Tax=Micromonospora phytophila TaxID=709888 RepID=UPI0020303D50|nr:sialidase family protein [Micromonospora phytophila]MCM0673647.1 glycoside hydrolase [Micromonospora phytophila]
MRARFEEVAETAAPPSRLSADAVYAAAWRTRRRRTTAWMVGGIVTGALVAGMGLDALRAPADKTIAQDPEPAQTADGWPAETRDGTVISAAAADASHVYAGVNACSWKDSVRHCTAQLVGSDDAGRTWTIRQTDFGDGQVAVPAPGVLLQTIETINEAYDGSSSAGPKTVLQPRISTDGGRSWRDVQAVTEAVAEVPAGGWIQCAPSTADRPCTLLAVDPATARSAPLAGQPALDIQGPVGAPTSAGFWITGHERGKDHRPAVAVSLDRGRTWSVHAFGQGEADFPVTATYASAVPSSVDGVTGYTIISVPNPSDTTGASPTSATTASLKQLIYRTGDGGKTWQRVNPDQTLPRGNYEDGDSYVAADGTHVVLTSADGPQRWYASSDNGNTYRPANLTGLGDDLLVSGMRAPVLVTAPGVYLAFNNTALYRSTDGIHWTRTLVQPPR